MITDIWVSGHKVDMYADVKIRHTLQVNDIAEIKDRQASFTNSFNIPKTENNVRIFQGLGITSDTSRVPYEKPSCQVKIDGFDLITKGWMNVTETDDEYKIYIYSGIIDFFKAIENKTIGKDLDLSEINHSKTMDVVTSSFNNYAYKYLVADYGGETLTAAGNINIDYLMPSVNAKWLWDKIFETFGFSYSGSAFGSLASKFVSYPKSKNTSEQLEEYARAKYSFVDVRRDNASIYSGSSDKYSRFFVSKEVSATKGAWIPYSEFNSQYQIFTPEFAIPYGHYVAPETGWYRIDISGKVDLPSAGIFGNYFPQRMHLIRNGIGKTPHDSLNDSNVIKTEIGVNTIGDDGFDCTWKGQVLLSAGESLALGFWTTYKNFSITSDAEIKITKIQNQEISFSSEFNDFAIKDFVKEILNLYGLTPFPSEHSNEIKFLTLKERINAPAIDWSSKYIARKAETYIYNDYAQKNIFRYKYTEKDASYNDASISINNKNIPEQKVVYDSKFYSPEKELSTMKIAGKNQSVYVFKMWDKDVKKDKVEYKSKDNRFFFIELDLVREIGNAVTYGTTFESGLTGETKTMLTVPLASFAGIRLQDFINSYYSEFTQIVENSRIHQIELDLHSPDYLAIDLSKLYYFAQEQQYYLLNKLIFDNDKNSGEFVRVRPTQPDGEGQDMEVEIFWEDGRNESRSGTDGFIKIFSKSYPGFAKNWFTQSLTEEYHQVSPVGDEFPADYGQNAFVLKQMVNGREISSNILFYNRIASPSDNTECLSYTVEVASENTCQYSYKDCEGQENSGSVGPGASKTFCALRGSVILSGNGVLLLNGGC